ncbi:hypothetical protein LTR09_001173 [Extremus antarcticus]|uniref:Uncharacterized protein n=1 Tax=Extremus antarcticus TaxID=702011 RepID=A0AAJ0GIB0_9PEZI|nr:hypothetical protein LTR09_001173 [Extremus antarcticus]
MNPSQQSSGVPSTTRIVHRLGINTAAVLRFVVDGLTPSTRAIFVDRWIAVVPLTVLSIFKLLAYLHSRTVSRRLEAASNDKPTPAEKLHALRLKINSILASPPTRERKANLANSKAVRALLTHDQFVRMILHDFVRTSEVHSTMKQIRTAVRVRVISKIYEDNDGDPVVALAAVDEAMDVLIQAGVVMDLGKQSGWTAEKEAKAAAMGLI